jgi:dTDP-4-dehydrorhamnose 3,5-epimerase
MGKFTFIKTGIEGLKIIEPAVFGDERGYFMETWRYDEFAQAGIAMNFVQDNQSKSRKGVLRGLHFQRKSPQGKLVRVISGEVFDVAVDLRKSSATFGKWHGVTLSAENKKQFYVPEGFAHGFLVLSDKAEFVYKCTRFYDPDDEGGLLWNAPDVGIIWPIDKSEVLLNDKDKKHPNLRTLDFSF